MLTGGAWRVAGRVAGVLLVLASLAFVTWKIIDCRLWTLEGISIPRVLVAIALGSLVYGADCVFLSGAWYRLVRWLGHHQTSFAACHVLYARTQIAKYLPGNLFHFASRQVMGRGRGLPHAVLAGSAILEIIGVLTGAGCVALVGVALRVEDGTGDLLLRLSLLLLVLITAPLLLNVIVHWTGLLQRFQFPDRGALQVAWSLLPIFSLYVAFFLVAGGIMVGLASVLTGLVDFSDSMRMLTAFALAWLAGFITPGAPAGTGVREAALVVALGPALGDSTALLIALALRITTTLGDVLFFASSFLIRGERERS